MRGRRTQSSVRRESLMFAGGGLSLVAGAVLVVAAFLDDTGSARHSEVAPIASELPPTVPPSTTTTTAAPRSFTLAASGDILAHSPVNSAAARYGDAAGSDYDYRPMFDRVAPLISAADLALCHLETPLAASSAEVRSGGSFEAPQEIAAAIRDAGFDGCSTASNHSLDGGEDAVVATVDVFDALGLGHAGTARSAAEATLPPIYDAAGAAVAHLSYTYGTNGIPVPEGREYLVNRIDPDRIVADAAAVRGSGAEVVIVSLHWGVEFTRDPTTAQREVAERLATSPDIDLVIGHHAHIVQPLTRVGDLVVAYGLGNLLTNQHAGPCCPAASQDGVIVQFHFTETGSATGEFTIDDVAYTATIVDRDEFTILPVAATLADPALTEAERRAFDASRQRTDEAITSAGPLAHPDV